MQEKKPPRHAKPAIYEKGQERIEAILEAATDVLINQGYKKMTLRQIALRAGITVGNLTYYYRSKDALLKDLLEKILAGYLEEIDRIAEASGEVPEDRFIATIEYLIDDLNTWQTTRFFPELWALSNHDEHAADLMEEMYVAERQAICQLIQGINPSLSTQQTSNIALFISCTIEGMTMFVGAGKRQQNALQSMKKMACESFLSLITQAGLP